MTKSKEIKWSYITNILKNNKLFKEIFVNPEDVIRIIRTKWSEPQRYYHGIEHLYKLLKISTDDKWVIVSCFHDIVYDPKKQDNEEKSIELFKSLLKKDVDEKLVHEIEETINDTKSGISSNDLSKDFQEADRWYLNNDKSTSDIRDIENGIFNEYSYVGFDVYKKKRLDFLKSQINKNNADIIKKHIDFVERWKKK